MGKLELVTETEYLSIYSPHIDGEEYNEFEQFMLNYKDLDNPILQKDFKSVVLLINQMLSECGARENLFRIEGRNIRAVPLLIQGRSKKYGTLRLYCIRISDKLMIIGRGGIKTVRRYQDDSYLNAIVEELKSIEHHIFLEARKCGIEYDDYHRMKKILERIEIHN